MSGCERVQGELPQYVADGEPALAMYVPLRGHLQGCADCRADAERLRAVEAALQTCPRVVPPVTLVPAIMSEVDGATQTGKEEWQPLSWEVWVPVVAFAVALLIAMISMPSRLFTSMTLQELETTIRTWAGSTGGWFAPLEQITRNDIFWVIWSSVFVTTAGVGLSLGLRHWNREAGKRLRELSGHLAEATDHLLQRERRAH